MTSKTTFKGKTYSTEHGCPTHDEQGRLPRWSDAPGDTFLDLPNADALRVMRVQEAYTANKVDGLSRDMIQWALADYMDGFSEDDVTPNGGTGFDLAGTLAFNTTDYGLARLADVLDSTCADDWRKYTGWMEDDGDQGGYEIAVAFTALRAKAEGYLPV